MFKTLCESFSVHDEKSTGNIRKRKVIIQIGSKFIMQSASKPIFYKKNRQWYLLFYSIVFYQIPILQNILQTVLYFEEYYRDWQILRTPIQTGSQSTLLINLSKQSGMLTHFCAQKSTDFCI